MKRRKPVNAISARQRKRLAEYAKVRRAHLEEHPWCETCPKIVEWLKQRAFNVAAAAMPLRPHWATEPHHIRGKLSLLLCDRRFFISTCRRGHDWIHANPDLARSLGLLCQRGDWGKLGP